MARDARMSDLISANPSFEQQMRDWQTERHQKGEHPFDWEAFRTLQAYIGATDPGDVPPAEFYWFTPPATTPHLTLAAVGSAGEEDPANPRATAGGPSQARAIRVAGESGPAGDGDGDGDGDEGEDDELEGGTS